MTYPWRSHALCEARFRSDGAGAQWHCLLLLCCVQHADSITTSRQCSFVSTILSGFVSWLISKPITHIHAICLYMCPVRHCHAFALRHVYCALSFDTCALCNIICAYSISTCWHSSLHMCQLTCQYPKLQPFASRQQATLVAAIASLSPLYREVTGCGLALTTADTLRTPAMVLGKIL